MSGPRALRFQVAVTPVGKARPRVVRQGGIVRTYTPAKTKRFENAIARAALAALGEAPPFHGAVEAILIFTFLPPSSWSKKRQAQARAGEIPHDVLPDIDNLEKAVLDGLAPLFARGDQQVVKVWKQKQYGAIEGVEVSIRGEAS